GEGAPEFIDEPQEEGWGEGGEGEGEEVEGGESKGEEGEEEGQGEEERDDGSQSETPKPVQTREPKIGKVIVKKADITGTLASLDKVTRTQAEKWLEVFSGRPTIVPIASEEGDEPIIEKVAEQDPECFKREVMVRPKASLSCGITVDISGSTSFKDADGRSLLDKFMDMTKFYTSLFYSAAKANKEVEFSLGAIGMNYHHILDFKESRSEKHVRAAVNEVKAKSKIDTDGINTLSVLDGIRKKYASQKSKKNKLEIIFTDGGERSGSGFDALRKKIRELEKEIGISVVFVGIGASAVNVKEYPTFLHIKETPGPAEMLRIVMEISRLKVRGKLAKETDLAPLLGYAKYEPKTKEVTNRVRAAYTAYMTSLSTLMDKSVTDLLRIKKKYMLGAWRVLNLSQLVFHEPGHLFIGFIENMIRRTGGNEKFSVKAAAWNTLKAVWQGKVDKPLPSFAGKYGGILGNITGLLIGAGVLAGLSYLGPGVLSAFIAKAIAYWILGMNALELAAQLIFPNSDIKHKRTTPAHRSPALSSGLAKAGATNSTLISLATETASLDVKFAGFISTCEERIKATGRFSDAEIKGMMERMSRLHRGLKEFPLSMDKGMRFINDQPLSPDIVMLLQASPTLLGTRAVSEIRRLSLLAGHYGQWFRALEGKGYFDLVLSGNNLVDRDLALEMLKNPGDKEVLEHFKARGLSAIADRVEKEKFMEIYAANGDTLTRGILFGYPANVAKKFDRISKNPTKRSDNSRYLAVHIVCEKADTDHVKDAIARFDISCEVMMGYLHLMHGINIDTEELFRYVDGSAIRTRYTEAVALAVPITDPAQKRISRTSDIQFGKTIDEKTPEELVMTVLLYPDTLGSDGLLAIRKLGALKKKCPPQAINAFRSALNEYLLNVFADQTREKKEPFIENIISALEEIGTYDAVSMLLTDFYEDDLFKEEALEAMERMAKNGNPYAIERMPGKTSVPGSNKPDAMPATKNGKDITDKAAAIMNNLFSQSRFPAEKTVIYLPSVKEGTFGEKGDMNKRLMGVYKKLRDKARDGYDMRNITVRFYDDGYFETSRKGEGLVLAEKIREDTRDPGSRVFIYSREERYDAVKGAIPEALTERVTAVREKVTNELSLTMVHTRVALAMALLTIKRNEKDTGDLTNNILSLFELLGGEDIARAIRGDKDALKKILSGELLIELKPFSEEIGEQMEAIEAVATSL
ncbi:MAG: VWA domain-containing protein, partial [Candidatus Omnitrophica bacterium]|nr:VWA domain-containing protein [Candidatus Omnitrophota bacterium]